jgi:hypothetical protein
MLAGATGLEPAASCVTGRRSNQLNYAPAFKKTSALMTLATSALRFPKMPPNAVTGQHSNQLNYVPTCFQPLAGQRPLTCSALLCHSFALFLPIPPDVPEFQLLWTVRTVSKTGQKPRRGDRRPRNRHLSMIGLYQRNPTETLRSHGSRLG